MVTPPRLAAATTVRTVTGFDTEANSDAFGTIELQQLADGNLLAFWMQGSGSSTPQQFIPPEAHVAVVGTTGTVLIGATALDTLPGTFAGDIIAIEVLPNGQLMALAATNNGTFLTYNTVLFNINVNGNTIDGTPGNDPALNGTPQDDTINGLGGNDALAGFAGNDQLNGGDGDDTLIGGLGNDANNGGIGIDTLNLQDATGNVSLSLNVNGDGSVTAAGIDSDTFTSIENVISGSGNDFLQGNALANRIEAGAGFDNVYGGG